MQIERELDTLPGGATKKATMPPPSPAGEVEVSPLPGQNAVLQPMTVASPPEPPFETLPQTTPSLSALAVSPVIEDHLRKYPQAAFDDMSLEVERVNFSGENAEALVKFKSPHVKELATSQRYILRKSGGQWGSRIPPAETSFQQSVPLFHSDVQSDRSGPNRNRLRRPIWRHGRAGCVPAQCSSRLIFRTKKSWQSGFPPTSASAARSRFAPTLMLRCGRFLQDQFRTRVFARRGDCDPC